MDIQKSLNTFSTPPPVGVAKTSVLMSMSVCLCVCVSVCLSVREHTSRTTHPVFTVHGTGYDHDRGSASSGGIVIRYVRYYRFFSARCYASALLAMGLCLSVCLCLSISLSQVGVLLKRLNVESQRQHHTIAQGI